MRSTVSQSDKDEHESLTERERDVLALLVERLSDREIAERLFLEVNTVKWYNRQIYDKLGVKNRREAIARAGELGLSDTAQRPTASRTTLATLLKHNLPSQTTQFIGRETELAELAVLLADDSVRLITILGPGGMGKTRLALELAKQFGGGAGHFINGVYFVPLAPLTASDNILAAIAEHTEYEFQQDGREPQQQLLDYLREKRLLLLLDNCDHLLDGVSIVSEILAHAPGVQVIATSRERLNLRGETVFNIGGMTYPSEDADAQATLNYSAVQLFMQSAARAHAGYELHPNALPSVVTICEQVQGMPLAIELAAGWVDALSPPEIAAEIANSLDILETEMRDMPQRQRSIRAVFDYSWWRMTEAEHESFMKMSVFRGGCTREAAQAVTGGSVRMLQALVNKALLQHRATGRYEIHELLRQYSEEQLVQSGAAEAVQDAHVAYYAAFIAEREADIKGRRQLAALNEIEADFENVRAAWQWAVASKDYGAIGKMADCLDWFCIFRNRLPEARMLFRSAWEQLDGGVGPESQSVWWRIQIWYAGFYERDAPTLERVLAMAQAGGDRAEIAFCQYGLANIAYRQKDYDTAIHYYQASLTYYRDVDDRFYVALLLLLLGLCYGNSGNSELYMQLAREGVDLQRKVGDQIGMANALISLGAVNQMLTGHVDETREYYREAEDIGHAMNNRATIARSRAFTGLVHFYEGDFDKAQELAEDALQVASDIGNLDVKSWALIVLGLIAAVTGKPEQGGRFSTEGQRLAQLQFAIYLSDFGLALAGCEAQDYRATGAAIRAMLDLAIPAGAAWGVLCLSPALVILAHQGQQRRAIELLGLVFSHPASRTTWLEKWPLMAQLRADLEVELGADAFDAAWARGASLDLHETLQELLAEFTD